MSIFQYPALNDNYHFIIICEETKKCAAVDVHDTKPLFQYINKKNLELVAVLNTHHHWDHIDGNPEIFKKFPNIKFYGSKYDFEKKRIKQQTNWLNENDKVKIGNIELNVIEVPGHTLGHIAYYNNDMAFVGDTIFGSGCGRLFEGSAKQMYESLSKLVDKIKDTTPIYCAHEYTLSNLKFAISLNNQYFEKYYLEVLKLREANQATVPIYLETEKKYNPFLMSLDNKNSKLLNQREKAGVNLLKKIREKKDSF